MYHSSTIFKQHHSPLVRAEGSLGRLQGREARGNMVSLRSLRCSPASLAEPSPLPIVDMSKLLGSLRGRLLTLQSSTVLTFTFAHALQGRFRHIEPPWLAGDICFTAALQHEGYDKTEFERDGVLTSTSPSEGVRSEVV
jgi:hypothetical protein